jgi:hypothetical protein
MPRHVAGAASNTTIPTRRHGREPGSPEWLSFAAAERLFCVQVTLGQAAAGTPVLRAGASVRAGR